MYQMWQIKCIRYGRLNVSKVANKMYQLWKIKKDGKPKSFPS